MEKWPDRMAGPSDTGKLQAKVRAKLGYFKKANPSIRQDAIETRASRKEKAEPNPRVPEHAERMGGGSFPMGGPPGSRASKPQV